MFIFVHKTYKMCLKSVRFALNMLYTEGIMVHKPDEKSFSALIDEFIVYISIERGLSQATCRAYSSDLLKYQSWLEERGIDDVSQIHSEDIEKFVVALQDESPRSIARRLAAIHEFHKFAVSRGRVSQDASEGIRPPKAGMSLPDALNVEEITALIEATADDDELDPIRVRDRALLEFMYASAGRVSEVVGANLSDIDLDMKVVRFTGKGDKQRLVPLGSYACQALRKYFELARPQLAQKSKTGIERRAIFLNKRGKRLSRQSVWEVVQYYGRAANITKDLHPHILRHSCATHLLQGGADVRSVQELLGHASVTTTQIYTHVTAQALMESYLLSHPRAQ